MKRWLVLGLAVCLVAGPVRAQTQAAGQNSSQSPLDFARIAGAAHKLSYAGTFVYQSGGGNPETSRVTHVIDASGERERLEVLDGSPREVVRINDEVRCYLPDQRLVIVERQGRQSFLPVQLPDSLAMLEQNYRVRPGGMERVAGRNAYIFMLEPRDGLRFGHVLWADAESGLLLKARMVGPRGETIEQFAFTQVRIGGSFDKDAFKPRLPADAAKWEVRRSAAVDTGSADNLWALRNPLPGFRRTAGVKRHLHNDEAETIQLVFSDGMVAISVFIEPLNPKEAVPASGVFSAGATQFYKRVASGKLLTVMGEVPAQTLMRLGDGLEPPKR